jgi:hypothetical protein
MFNTVVEAWDYDRQANKHKLASRLLLSDLFGGIDEKL